MDDKTRLLEMVEVMAELIRIGAVMAMDLKAVAEDSVEASGDEEDGAYLRSTTARWDECFARFEALNNE